MHRFPPHRRSRREVRPSADREPVAVPAAVNPGPAPSPEPLSASACSIDGRTSMRRTAYILSIVIGSILIIGGVAT